MFTCARRIRRLAVRWRFAAAAAIQLSGIACSTPARLPAVPQTLAAQAQTTPGPVRYLVARETDTFLAEGMNAAHKEQAYLASQGHTGPLPPAYFLAISGGGDNGAFGAGLLNGWTAAGTRPEFKAVTGVSTGALIAPFAFLGPDYDAALREVYTTMTPDKVYRARRLAAALFNDAMADTGPLAEIIAQYADQKMLDAIAAEYRKGRLLMIGTT